jgi:hypothetical protein
MGTSERKWGEICAICIATGVYDTWLSLRCQQIRWPRCLEALVFGMFFGMSTAGESARVNQCQLHASFAEKGRCSSLSRRALGDAAVVSCLCMRVDTLVPLYRNRKSAFSGHTVGDSP